MHATLASVDVMLQLSRRLGIGAGRRGCEPLPPPTTDFLKHWNEDVSRMTAAQGHQVLCSLIQPETEEVAERMTGIRRSGIQICDQECVHSPLLQYQRGFFRVNASCPGAFGVVGA